MFRKYGFACLLMLLFSGFVNAQANLLNAKKVDEIGKKSAQKIAADNDAPLSYGYIDDRDILWSKVVWEVIDLNQKINFPYYYPIDTVSNISPDRRSLFDTLMKGINSGKIKNTYTDSFFTKPYTDVDLKSRLFAEKMAPDGVTPLKYDMKSEAVQAYMIKGMWYFDKRNGELRYRILGIAPMGNDIQAVMQGQESKELFDLFWLFYPSIRDVLHQAKVFNPQNVSQPISFDHLLNARRFNSVIVREENIYGNREVKDYVRGNSLFQLLEADKIKESIRDKEMDMWNY